MKNQSFDFENSFFLNKDFSIKDLEPEKETICFTYRKNWELYNNVRFFSEDGDIFLSVSNSLISKILLYIQTVYLNDILPILKSQWTHTGFIYKSKDYLLHSYPFGYTTKSFFKNGVQLTRLKKYVYSSSLCGFAVIKLKLSPQERKELISLGLNYLTKGYKYGFTEVIGTLLRIIQSEIFRKPEILIQTKNILNSPKGLYCSAFVFSVLNNFCKKYKPDYPRPFGKLDYELSLVDFLYYPELEKLFTPNPSYLKLVEKIYVFYKEDV